MYAHAPHSQENKNNAVAANPQGSSGGGSSVRQFSDNRPEALVQRKWREIIDNAPGQTKVSSIQGAPNSAPIQQKTNNTGLPDTLKSGVENLSGYSMDDVKVHYNSDKPAQLQAHAYAQGTDIHLAPGQEKHLPHEAWHVVQQKQGRVQPTAQLKGLGLNEDAGLEREADRMGNKAVQLQAQPRAAVRRDTVLQPVAQLFSYSLKQPIEGVAMNLEIVDTGTRLEIIDRTVAGKKTGVLRGYIDYKKDKQELILDHFEAHPAGAGLGTLLMFELSQVALHNGYKVIAVATPALSAMGAYKAFGGKPRDPQQHGIHKQMYLDAMSQDEGIHKRFVNTEAEAVAEAEVAKANYFNPDLGPVGEGNLFSGTKGDHKIAHSGAGDFERAADLMALSAQLIYESTELQSKTYTSLDKKWKMS